MEVDYVTREQVFENFNSVWAMLTAGAPPIEMIFNKIAGKKENYALTVENQFEEEKELLQYLSFFRSKAKHS